MLVFSGGGTFYGDQYKIEYDSNWSVVELKRTDGTTGEALEYKTSGNYLAPIGTSSLSSFEYYMDCDFTDSSCRDEIYNEFYDCYKQNVIINKCVQIDINFWR